MGPQRFCAGFLVVFGNYRSSPWFSVGRVVPCLWVGELMAKTRLCCQGVLILSDRKLFDKERTVRRLSRGLDNEATHKFFSCHITNKMETFIYVTYSWTVEHHILLQEFVLVLGPIRNKRLNIKTRFWHKNKILLDFGIMDRTETGYATAFLFPPLPTL